MLKDNLLNCLNEMANALEASITTQWIRFDYFDGSLGERRVCCASCGQSSTCTSDIKQSVHQSWCHIALAQTHIANARKYLGQ